MLVNIPYMDGMGFNSFELPGEKTTTKKGGGGYSILRLLMLINDPRGKDVKRTY